jgi:acyl-CoA synthetase (AMP-forming)/AMP-acid ligase II
VQALHYRSSEFSNFGFDIMNDWARKDRNKLAMIRVNQRGQEKKITFLDFANLSNQAANILLKYGINTGDRVLVMLPRIPEWWIFALALIKRGAGFTPYPTMITPEDHLGKDQTERAAGFRNKKVPEPAITIPTFTIFRNFHWFVTLTITGHSAGF